MCVHADLWLLCSKPTSAVCLVFAVRLENAQVGMLVWAGNVTKMCFRAQGLLSKYTVKVAYLKIHIPDLPDSFFLLLYGVLL